ncbi:helix-turn-helix domain-containing protein [Pontibacillus yanchengensis]|uniref:Helix-turn-helix domain-containing protein n=1 Tax=Pontibacillus yanchengensis TaxID=462910 RepID=A0ACC7VJH4_9BACI|nr:helix-turn-helix transcriptional regulator [Pontibacillus yanchengensis]MYL54334.1 helix-turn-helix domain-containing protein [Pontibacillus yanchengensis]
MNGEKIKDLRTKRGLSLTELSRESGVSKSYLSFLERGMQQNPSIEVIEKIAHALKVDVHTVLTDERQRGSSMSELDYDVLELARELKEINVDKEKLRKLIELMK